MKIFEFLPVNHEWKIVGKKNIHPHCLNLPHKHLFCPTMLSSFIDYVDFDVYQNIRADFLKGKFYYLANNDEYAYMLLFDLMNGFPDNAIDMDFVKLNDELGVLRRLSQSVDKFFNTYIKTVEYQNYLSMDKKGLMKEFVEHETNTFRFPYHASLNYEPIVHDVLPPNHHWTFVDTSKPLNITRDSEPFFELQNFKKRNNIFNIESYTNEDNKDLCIIKRMANHISFERLLQNMDNLDWKNYMEERRNFLAGKFSDLTYKPSVALHLYYDIQGGDSVNEDERDLDKLQNELWVLNQLIQDKR